MRIRTTTWVLVALALIGSVPAARAASFTIQPITFAQAPTYSVIATGTILTAGNTSTITDWNLKVTTAEHVARYTPGNSANMSFGDLACDGTQILVGTSPDGYADGGRLFFRSPNPLLDFGVGVADFTGYVATGGQAMYMAGASFDFFPLDQPNNAQYVAATRLTGNVYSLVPVQFWGGATISGTITTDGTTGPLAPNHIVSWDVAVDQLTEDVFTAANSTLLANLVGLGPNGTTLTVMNPDGRLTFSKGSIGGHLHGLMLADFTTQSPLGGQAGYFQGNLAVTTIDLNAPVGPWTVTDANLTPVIEPAALGSRLGQPWPNPCNPRVNVELAVARPGHHLVRVIDAAGRAVATVFDDVAPSGSLVLQWDGRDNTGRAAPSGVYFLELTGASVDTRRFALVR